MTEITDAQALDALNATIGGRAQPAEMFATHTVYHPMEIERKPGVKHIEIRPFISMGQYYPERKLEQAKDVKRRYAELNKTLEAKAKAAGYVTYRKAPVNPLNVEAVEIG